MEIWKDVINYNGAYAVSNLGRVKSLNYRRTGKQKIMKQPLNTMGYPIVRLSKNGKTKTRTVHQLVAEAFLNHKPNGYKSVIDHIDENPKNNAVYNLQIISHRKNVSKSTNSRFNGVTKQGRKWKAAAYLNGKVKHLGMFNCEFAGHVAYFNATANA